MYAPVTHLHPLKFRTSRSVRKRLSAGRTNARSCFAWPPIRAVVVGGTNASGGTVTERRETGARGEKAERARRILESESEREKERPESRRKSKRTTFTSSCSAGSALTHSRYERDAYTRIRRRHGIVRAAVFVLTATTTPNEAGYGRRRYDTHNT